MRIQQRHLSYGISAIRSPMEWTPPPRGIAMCQDGTERCFRTRDLLVRLRT